MNDIITTLKIVIIGDSGVGKSSLLLKFVDDNFDLESPKTTLGVDFKTKKISVDGIKANLEIWDTSGQERFQSIIPTFYRNAQGAILVYSVDNSESFINIEYWLNELHKYENETKQNLIKMIVGNKTDLEKKNITKEDGVQLAKKFAASFFETSSLTAEGVQSAFEELAKKIIQTPYLWEPHHDRLNLKDNDKEHENQFKCFPYQCSVL